jgi:acetyltransferase-like isoleucine patch superfamily enzyme
VKIGQCSWICVGSSISNDITIGRNVIVGAGAVVIQDVPDNVMVAGVPAVFKKTITP